MKVYINDLYELKIYKNKQLLFGSSSNKLKGNIFMTNLLFSDEMNYTIKSNIFVNTFIRGYYHPRIAMVTSCRNKKIPNKQKDIYSTIKSKYPTIKYTKFNLDNYNNFNTFYDFNEFNKLFNKVYEDYTFIKKATLLNAYLREMVSKVSSYNNIYIHIIPSALITTGRYWSFENILYYWAKTNVIDEDFFSKLHFIFSDKNGKIMFTTRIYNEKNNSDFSLMKFKRFCNIIYKYNTGISLDNDEISAIESDKDDIGLDDNLKKKEEAKKEVKNIIKTNSKLTDKSLENIYNLVDTTVDSMIAVANTKHALDTLKKETDINKQIDTEVKLQSIAKKMPYKSTEELNKELVNKEIISKTQTPSVEKSAVNTTKKATPSKNISSDRINYGNSEYNTNKVSNDVDDDNSGISSDFNDFTNISDEEDKINQKVLERLKNKQSQVKVTVNNQDVSLDSIIENTVVDDIDTKEIEIDTLNEEVRKSTLKDFDRSYVNLQKDKDMYKIISAFNNDPEVPIFVTNIKRENTSDAFNKKETLTISYEDTNKKKYTIKIDVPIVIDNSFLYLNNGKKTISKQLNVKPIIKVSPDEAIITTNYSKVYISRYGQKVTPNLDRLKKFFLNDIPKTDKKINVKAGSNIGVNSKFGSSVEYDEISNYFVIIEIDTLCLNFNRINVIEYINDKTNIDVENTLNKNEFALGVDTATLDLYTINTDTSEVIVYDKNRKLLNKFNSIFDLILFKIKNYNQEYYRILLGENISKKFMYSRISVLNNKFPLIALLGFYFGMEKVLERYNLKFEFLEKKKHLTDDESVTENMIQFKDGFLYYDNSKFGNNLLLSGLTELNTKEIEFTSLNRKETYYDIFEELLGNRQITKGINNFLSLFLDPITKEVLNDLNLPTDLLDVFLYVNDLLSNNLHTKINDMHNYRLRSIELINDELYLLLANAVKEYKDLYKAGRTEARLNIKQDQLIKNLLESQIIDSYSTLNPVLEIEKLGTSNYKGLGGTNKDTAFTPDMRSYDKSMVGLLGMSSPDSGKVGIVRQLSMDPNISTTRGFIEPHDDVNELNATNMYTVGELLSTYTSTHADPPRIGMETQQNKHSVPTKLQSKALYGSGIERTLPYMLSTDFVDVAEEDGIVEKIDNTNELAILKYKSGKTKVIDISDKQSYNGNGGLTNKKPTLNILNCLGSPVELD